MFSTKWYLKLFIKLIYWLDVAMSSSDQKIEEKKCKHKIVEFLNSEKLLTEEKVSRLGKF